MPAKVTIKGTKVFRDGMQVASIYGHREISAHYGAIGGYGVLDAQGNILTPSPGSQTCSPNRPFCYFKNAADWCRSIFAV